MRQNTTCLALMSVARALALWPGTLVLTVILIAGLSGVLFGWHNATTVRKTNAQVQPSISSVLPFPLSSLLSTSTLSQNRVVTTVSAASFEAPVAPESIAAIFGEDLATGIQIAPLPLPSSLLGTSVLVRDSAGVERPAPLFFVAPSQINCLIPTGTAEGTATITVKSGKGNTETGTVTISNAAPSIFTANTYGNGVPAATALRIKGDGSFGYEAIAEGLAPKAIDLGPDGETVYLILYLSGLRYVPKNGVRIFLGGSEAPPENFLYARSPEFIGVDQLNLRIPRSLIGRGRLKLTVSALGRVSNEVEIEIGGRRGTEFPQVDSISKATDLLAGEEIFLNGARFAPTRQDNIVRFGTAEARIISSTSGQLRLRVPYGAESGPITVITPQGEGRSGVVTLRTTISGIVKDTHSVPIAGVKVTLINNNRTVQTDSEGVFFLSDVPNATQVYLQFDGRNVTGAVFPDPPVKVRIFPNRDNLVQTPVFLQQVNGDQTQVGGTLLDNSETREEITLTAAVPDQTGIGELKFIVPSGTKIRFPNGATSGTLILNAVENGLTPVKLPPDSYVSVVAQIAFFGASLEPGGKLIFPNTDNLPSGTQARLFRYDVNFADTNSSRGEWVDTKDAVTVIGDRIETSLSAVKETSYYFIAAPRPTTTATGRVVEDTGTADGRPIAGAVVRIRGKEAVTDGNGGFVLRGIAVNNGDAIAAEVNVLRADGQVNREQSKSFSAVVNGLTTMGAIILSSDASGNRAPIALLPTSVTVTAGEQFDQPFVASDPDPGQSISSVRISDQRIAEILARGNGAYTLRLKPVLSDANQTYILILTVTDNLGKSQSYEITVIVRAGLRAIAPPVSTDEDQPVSFRLSGTDPEGKPLSYLIGSQPDHGKLSGTAPNLTYIPDADYNGLDVFTFVVSNGTKTSPEVPVTVLIRPVNDLPKLTVPGAQTVNYGQPVSFTVTGADPDTDQTLTCNAFNRPSGATFAPSGNREWRFTWAPTISQVGSYTVTFILTDSQGASDTKTVTINVISNDPNRAPVLTVPAAQTVNEGQPLNFTLSASDPDIGQTLTFSSPNSPSGATLNPSNGQFNWTPGFTQAGVYDVTFTVTDNGSPAMSDSKTVKITVNNSNRSPVANSQSVTTNEDTPLNITLTGSDADGDSLSFAIVGNPSNGSLSGTGATRTYTPNLNFNGSDSFTFKVNDGSADSNVATVIITVNPVNDAPVLTVPGAQSVNIGQPLSFTITASDVDGGQTLTLSATNLPTGTAFTQTSATSGQFSWTPTAAQAGNYSVTFRAADNGSPSLSDSKNVSVTVNAPTNPSPTVTSLNPNSATTGGAAFTLSVSGTNFVNGSVVRWNGSNRTTVFVSSTQLTAQVSSSDIAAAGTASVTVFNPAPGGGTSNSANFVINAICSYSIPSSPGPPVGAGSGKGTVSVSTSSGCAWTATSNASWITITSGASGSGPGTVNYSVEANISASQRTGTMTIAGQTFTITQFGSIPTITSITPNSANAGGPSFTLTVNGSNFVPSSVVRWNGSDRTTTFVSPLQLTASIPASDISTSGAASITIFNPAPGGTSNAVSFIITGASTAPLMNVSAASFRGAELAVESQVFGFGERLATSTQLASTVPLPTSVAGTTVRIRDSVGTEHLAPLYLVSPNLVQYLIPSDTATGNATITVTSGDGVVSTGTVKITTLSPGLFTESDYKMPLTSNANGRGAAFGIVLRVRNGVQTFEPIARFDSGLNKYVPVPIDIGLDSDIVYLLLYGTGIRKRSKPENIIVNVGGLSRALSPSQFEDGVAAAGFVGLDQVMILLSRSLIGRGDVALTITVDGKTSNAVDINIAGGATPGPVIANINPNSALAGGSGFTLTVNGANFINGSLVRWNGSNRATMFVSNTQLTAQISASDIVSVSTASIAVANSASNISNTLSFPIAPVAPRTMATVSLASFAGGQIIEVASESLVTSFGTGLATAVAQATTLPLPTSLAGTRVIVRDANGTERLAPLFLVAPGQIVYQIPSGTANGPATLILISSDGAVSIGSVRITTVAPGLFSANASGQGVADGRILRVKGDGSQSYEDIFNPDGTARPIDLGPATDRVFLNLYATGVRFRSSLSAVSVTVGIPHTPTYVGSVTVPDAPLYLRAGGDQITVELSKELSGSGDVPVSVNVDGKLSNALTVKIGGSMPAVRATPIATGQTVTGSLTINDQIQRGASGKFFFFDAYSFTTTAPNTTIAIDLRSTSFDAAVLLYNNANGTLSVIAADDQSGNYGSTQAANNNALLMTVIPAPGNYIIFATSSDLDPNGLGNYTLKLLNNVATPITYGQTLSGSISTSDLQTSAGTYLDLYWFNGVQGDNIRTNMNAPVIDSFLILHKNSGEPRLAQDDNTGGGKNAQITYGLTTSGIHLIIATPLDPNVTGNYSISLAKLSGIAADDEKENSGKRPFRLPERQMSEGRAKVIEPSHLNIERFNERRSIKH